MSSPLFALDMRAGRTPLLGLMDAPDTGRFMAMLQTSGDEGNTAGWLTQFMMESGQWPYYVNLDGSTVNSLEPDANRLVKNGAVLVVPIRGVIVKDAWDVEELFYGLCSSARISATLEGVRDDDRVASVVLTPYSPGGMVYGIEGVGEAVKALNAIKPVIACVDHLAGSAAYWAISQARQIMLMGRTSEVGSIGVMNSWMDLIPYWEAQGAKYREFYAPESKHKNEEWRAIREKEDGALLEQSMSSTAQLFQQIVREGRGAKLNTADESVLAGRVYEGDAAIAAGLADGYASLWDAIDSVRGQAGVSASSTGRTGMARTALNEINTDTDNNSTMSKIARVVAAVAAALGFDAKDEITSDDIQEANKALKEKGLTAGAFVSTAEVERLATAAQQVSDALAAKTAAETALATAEQARTTAETALATANTEKQAAETKATDATAAREAVVNKLQEAATKNSLEVGEGADIADVVVGALAASNARVAELEQEVAKLRGEDAPDDRAEGVVNKKGDKKDATKSDVLSQMDDLVKIDEE